MNTDDTPAESHEAQAPPGEPPVSPPAAIWLRVIGRLGALFLGGVLVVALYGKMLDPQAFTELISHEGLDFLLPAAWVAAIGLGLEAVLGFALLFGLRHWKVLIPSAGLVAFFVFLTARTYYKHVTGQHEATGSCGCFGNIIERTPAEAFWQDIFLLVPPMVFCFLGRPTGPLPMEKLRWGLTWGLSAAVLGFAWLAPGLPIDDLATRLKPGVAVSEMCAGSEDARVCMLDVVPELAQGRHVVVLADMQAEAFAEQQAALNDYALTGEGPRLWVLTGAPQEDLDLFQMTNMPAFSLLTCPPGLMRPLYRTLPRTFRVEDGVVTETRQDWPALAAEQPADGLGGSDVGPPDPDAGDDDPGDGG